MLDKNHIMLINDIIYKIYNIKEFDQMRYAVLEALRFLIPFDSAGFFLTSGKTPYTLSNPIGVDNFENSLEEYLNSYQELDYTRWTFAASTGKAYRETDLLEDEVRVNHPYYKAMFVPMNMHYSMILTIIKNGVFLGVINLLRSREHGDFTDEEVFLFECFEDHLAARCSASMNREKPHHTSQPSKKDLVETYHLTMRETEVVYHLLEGVSREDICDKLCISPNTLKKHIVNIYKKLKINSWRELFQLLKE